MSGKPTFFYQNHFMNVATISTRRLTGLDYRIWLVMAACWVVCLGLFGYKKVKATTTTVQPCGAVRILVNGVADDGIAVCNPDVTTLFQAEAPPNVTVEWDFNDGSEAVKDVRAMHKFKAEDDYKVVVTVNGRCEYTKEITVRKIVPGDAVKPSVKIFADSVKATTGSRIRFSAVANVPASSYQWMLLPTAEKQAGEDVTFSFFSAGEFTVQVVINNDPATRQEQKITITDVPQAALPNPGSLPSVPPSVPPGPWDNSNRPPPVPPTHNSDTVAKVAPPADNIREADPETFKGLLQGVLKGDKKATDLYPYLKYEGSTQVEVNNKQPFMSLDDFCNSKRNKKIKKLDFIRQKDNPKHIQTIKVELKGFWPF